MCYYLVDYENVRPRKLSSIIGFTRNDSMVVFYSDRTTTMSKNFLIDLIKNNIRVKFIKVDNGHKNALDFQLSSYVGYLIALGYQDIRIVSNDLGYESVCKFWTNIGCNVKRIDHDNCCAMSKGQKEKDKILIAIVIDGDHIKI